MKWKSRIVGHDNIDPKELKNNPLNWRRHPQIQRSVLEDVLSDVGWIQEVIVNKRTGFIIDGHLRVEMALERGEKVPVLYVDMSEEEERLILAAFDPITELAEKDEARLDELLDSVATGSEAVNELLKKLRPVQYDPSPDTEPKLGELEYHVIIDCASESHQGELLERFQKEGLKCRALML